MYELSNREASLNRAGRKAFIVGILLNIGLQQVPIEPLPSAEVTAHYEQQQHFQRPSSDIVIGFLNQTGGESDKSFLLCVTTRRVI